MSKRKERIALRDRHDFKRFVMVVGIVVVVLIIVIYLIFNQMS